MFHENPENTEAVDRLCEAFSDAERGTTILWSEIETVMGRHRDDSGGRWVIQRWRRWMERERRIVMHANQCVGLDVLTHSSTVTSRAAWRTSRARRQVHWGLRELGTVNPFQLSDHERRALAIRGAHLRDQRKRLLAAQREARKEIDPQPSAHEMRRRVVGQ